MCIAIGLILAQLRTFVGHFKCSDITAGLIMCLPLRNGGKEVKGCTSHFSIDSSSLIWHQQLAVCAHRNGPRLCAPFSYVGFCIHSENKIIPVSGTLLH